MRFTAVPAAIFSILSMACLPAAALAGGTGGVSAGSPSAHSSTDSPGGAAAAGAPAQAHPPAHVQTAPVTSNSTALTYAGPVYERTASGQIVPYVTAQASGELGSLTGGASAGQAAAPTKPELLVPGRTARYVDGLAAAPMAAPLAIQKIVWAANQIVGDPYVWGGGHASFSSPGYDCSGTVSFALHGGHLLSSPEDSSEFLAYGSRGVGRWVTVFTNPEHAYMTVAGLRLDTSSADDPSDKQGPRWRPLRPANGGFSIRHPSGY